MKTIEFNGTVYTSPLSDRFRRHSESESAGMRASIAALGVRVAVRLYHDTTLDIPDCVLDGEGRLGFAAELGLKQVPFFHEGKLSTEDAYALAKTLNDERRHDDPAEVQKRRAERIERVVVARTEGKSLRAIAEAEDVSAEQVRRDLITAGVTPVTGGADVSGESPVTPVTPELPKVITGRDGKPYAASKPKPEQDLDPDDVFEWGDDADNETGEPVEREPEQPPAMDPNRSYPKPRPAWMTGGNKVDPDHPHADVLKAMTALVKAVNKALARDDAAGAALKANLSEFTKLVKVRQVLHTSGLVLNGAVTSPAAKFVGMSLLRSLVRKSTKKMTPAQLRKLFEENGAAPPETVLAEEGDE